MEPFLFRADLRRGNRRKNDAGGALDRGGEGRGGEGNRSARCQISPLVRLACFAKLMLIGPFQKAAKLLKCGVECVNLFDDSRVNSL